MRECEKEIGRRYGRWKVSANASNLGLPGTLAGVVLVAELTATGGASPSGHDGPPARGRWLYESFPYLALVGAAELGYDVERPIYKRKPRHARRVPTSACCAPRTPTRSSGASPRGDPPIDLRSHPVTAALLDEPTPLADRAAKHREDLLDAVLCAWTGLLWLHHGLDRCQVLGDAEGRRRRPPPGWLAGGDRRRPVPSRTAPLMSGAGGRTSERSRSDQSAGARSLRSAR